MGRSQRDKGARAEREFAKLIGGERVPLSGAAGGSYRGDVIGLGLRWECKVRGDGFKQLYNWIEGKDALAIRADRKEWLVILPLDKFREIYQSAKEVEIEWATDVWIQFGMRGEKDRISGGIGTLKYAEKVLREAGKIDKNGLFEWEKE